MENTTVRVWEEQISIPTYETGKPDKNPMFFEKRVYQGSSGVVYPYPVVEKIYDTKADKRYNALFLENDFIKVMILPQLGGRIQMAYDKIKNRHFIYYNQVIKPALVGLTGPWISGGIEFNWPQHHRPGTFSPVDYTITEGPDGSKTVWVNEIERLSHTKGMAGFTLYPGKAFIEINVKLLNTSSLPQTFLWWANPAVKVNDHYQSVFPPDVNAVFDHGKRDVSNFPVATGTYYKVDYAPGTDISLYKNIPVPTSYMAINSAYDFVGGYEHDSRAGMLHVADHHVSPGKKQWTWGHGDFGQAWDRHLTDEDGPYIELMAGVFTDNQPDFTWIMPNEEKSFTQYFLPYHDLGLVKNATKDMLVALDVTGNTIVLQVYATSAQPNITIQLFAAGEALFTKQLNIGAATACKEDIQTNRAINPEQLLLTVSNHEGEELIRYEPALNKKNELPAAAAEALLPEEINNNEQLFLTGQHLEQYRHATRSPVPYYEKALQRDAGDSRVNTAMGLWWLRRGRFQESIPFFKKAIATITQRNPNPADCEPWYYWGLALKYLGQYDAAFDAFYKAAWDKRWKDSSYFCLAQIDMIRGHWQKALEHINISISNNTNNNKAYTIKAAALRKLRQWQHSIDTCAMALKADAFNLAVLYEQSLAYKAMGEVSLSASTMETFWRLSRGDEQNFLACALEYMNAGMYEEGASILQMRINNTVSSPMLLYYMAYCTHHTGNAGHASAWLAKAAAADPYLCFPNRLDDVGILTFAQAQHHADAKAPYYLGNLWYDKKQYEQAIVSWELSAKLDNRFPTVLRNLGIAYYNKRMDKERALTYFEKAFALDTTDARLLMELDQLYKRINRPPQQRGLFLEENMETVLLRDDLYLEYISLLNFTGQHRKALDMLLQHAFHPWEGGEGKASAQYVFSLVELAKQYLYKKDFTAAINLLQRSQAYPHNLGEGKLYGAQENDIFYWLGIAHEGNHDHAKAEAYFNKAAAGNLQPAAAVFYNDQQPDTIFYQGLACSKTGNHQKANDIFNSLCNYGNEHVNDEPVIDYFAVSLPNLLVFDDDLPLRNKIHCWLMLGLGSFGLEQYEAARQYFSMVLEADAENQKAVSHLHMVELNLAKEIVKQEG